MSVWSGYTSLERDKELAAEHAAQLAKIDSLQILVDMHSTALRTVANQGMGMQLEQFDSLMRKQVILENYAKVKGKVDAMATYLVENPDNDSVAVELKMLLEQMRALEKKYEGVPAK